VIITASIKNNVSTSITHINLFLNPIKKMIHHAVNVTSMEAELFTIRCGINQTVQIPGVSCIIVIHVAYHIFDSLTPPYQLQTIAISKELREFFNKDLSNSIDFWDCPSNRKWPLHSLVNKETKEFNLTPLFPCKSSWDFNRKSECDDLLKQGKMFFQASDNKSRHFLDLLDNDLRPIEPSYAKGGSWIKYFGHLDSLCPRATCTMPR